ncbi:MAG TPA: acyltransferase [Acidobacteriaceae bacterium]|jgi:peptidoglycan/LPS O-acetylase OafA/YrhL
MEMRAGLDRSRDNIDFLRLAFALLVVFAHSFTITQGSDRAEPFMRLTRGQVTGGHIAVDAFFILSGFLITASYERSGSARSFLKKRIARVYPGFFALTVVTALFFAPLAGGEVEGRGVLGKLVLVISSIVRLKGIRSTGVFAANPLPYLLNASLWTVSYEFLCYLGVLVLGVAMLLHRRRVLVIIFGASIAVSILYLHFGWYSSKSLSAVLFGYPQDWARFIPMYLAGVVFYLYRTSIPLHARGALLAAATMVAACILPFGYSLLFPVCGTYLLMYLAFCKRLPLYRVMRFGDLSYGTYLYAFPIQQLLVQHFALRSPLRLFAAATPLVLVAAAVSWFSVERPALRFIKQRSLQNTAGAPVGVMAPVFVD